MVTLPTSGVALIVIDMQRDFCAEGGYAHSAGMDITALQKPIPNIQKLLHAVRKRQVNRSPVLVVHTREGHRADLMDCPATKLRRSFKTGGGIGSRGPMGRLLVRGEYGHDLIDELRPEPGEPIIDKSMYDAFFQTDLDLILRNNDISTVIITGVTTEVCVTSTLRGAVERGYTCMTVSDACASSQPQLHEAALAMVLVEGGIFGSLVTTQELLDALQR